MSEEIAATTATEQTTEAASSTEAVVVSGQDTAAETPAASGTLASSDPVEKPVAAPADFPEDWRQKLAGNDEKELARLQRMGSPADVWKAYRALEAKISSGQLKAGLKPDATAEEVAQWRKDNGLPEKPEDYRPNLPNGMVPGEADMPLIGGFQKTAHKIGMTPEQFNETLAWWFSEQDAAKAQQYEADTSFRSQAEDALRAEWGPAYRSEVRGIANFMEATGPAGLADLLFNSRSPDGQLLGDHPEILRWLSSRARAENPMATLVPSGSGDIMKAGEARISEIEQMMRTDPGAYWKNQDIQTEYGKLLEARESMRGRAA